MPVERIPPREPCAPPSLDTSRLQTEMDLPVLVHAHAVAEQVGRFDAHVGAVGEWAGEGLLVDGFAVLAVTGRWLDVLGESRGILTNLRSHLVGNILLHCEQ